MGLLGRKPRCPRCKSKNHVDPNVHNTRIVRAIPRIAKLRLDLELMEFQECDEVAVEAVTEELVKLYAHAQFETRYADPQYQSIEELILQHARG